MDKTECLTTKLNLGTKVFEATILLHVIRR